MPLVHVEHFRGRAAFDLGVGPDGADTADTGEDLLPDAVFLVAAVEPVGDRTQVVFVLTDIGIEQQQRNSANLGDPDP